MGSIVISTFDGMSCAQQALERSGISVDQYYASEIDKYAIKITQKNYPKTIQVGDVRDLVYKDRYLHTSTDSYYVPEVHFLFGGSPCQSFSFAGKRKGMQTVDSEEVFTLSRYLQLKSEGFEFIGESYLFWEYVRLLGEIRTCNPDVIFLLENVLMGKKWQPVISRAVGINPIQINSALLSAQNRERLYWTNISPVKISDLFGEVLVCGIDQPDDKKVFLKHIVELDADEKYMLSDKMIDWLTSHSNKNKLKGNGFNFKPKNLDEKANCLNTRIHKMGVDDNYIVHSTMRRSSKTGKGGTGLLSRHDGKSYCLDTFNSMCIEGFSNLRRLTPLECERLQGVKDGYTEGVSDTQRYKMLGNGWNVDTIVYILSHC